MNVQGEASSMRRGARLICADMATRATAASSVRLGAGWEVMSVVVMPWVDGWRTPCFLWARLEASMERADSLARLAAAPPAATYTSRVGPRPGGVDWDGGNGSWPRGFYCSLEGHG